MGIKTTRSPLARTQSLNTRPVGQDTGFDLSEASRSRDLFGASSMSSTFGRIAMGRIFGAFINAEILESIIASIHNVLRI